MSFIGQFTAYRGKLNAELAMSQIMRRLQREINDISKQLKSLDTLKRAQINALNAKNYAAAMSMQGSIMTQLKSQFGVNTLKELQDENGQFTPTGWQQYSQAEAMCKQTLAMVMEQEKSRIEDVYEAQKTMLEEDKAEVEAQLACEKQKYETLRESNKEMYETHKKWNSENLKQMYGQA